MNSNLLKSVLLGDVCRTAVQRGPLSGQRVYLFVEVSIESVFEDIDTLSHADTPGETGARRRLHSQDLPCSKGFVQVATSAPKVQKQWKALLYQCFFDTSDNVPETLGSFYNRDFYA